MTKFNKKTPDSVKLRERPDATVNYEGGLAFEADSKTELTIRFLTFLVGEPKFYTSGTQDTQEIEDLIAEVAQYDPEYIMKLASYARNKMYLRSAPLFALIEGVQYENVRPFVRKYTPEIIKRADEITEILAYYIAKNGQIGDGIVQGAGSGLHGSLANSLKKGLAEAFHNFDEYQFAKWSNRKGDVTFKDALRMVHPKPKTAEYAELFGKIINDTLETPMTWEVVLSTMSNPETGEKFATKKEAWETVLHRVGYMAKLRNLRNMLQAGVDIEPVAEHLENPNAVKYSKQFPFRFLSAKKVLTGYHDPYGRSGSGLTNVDPFANKRLVEALEKALEASVVNLPNLKGKTFTSSDNSGSMSNPISVNSSLVCNEVANIMAALTYHMCDNAIASVFGESFRVVPISSRDGILSNAERLIQTNVGHATNAWLALEYLNANKIDVDRIFIFSDMQCYDMISVGGYISDGYNRSYRSLAGEFAKYKKINPNVILYSWNLVGYNTLQFPEDDRNVVNLSGWSDNVLKFIPAFEEFGSGSMIKEIENYVPESFKEIEDEK